MNSRNYPTVLFGVFTSIVLVYAWLERGEYWHTAEEGLGYAFGIIGSIMMLLLLLYPARKYWKAMRNVFKVHHWFRLHMVFGVCGPVFILLHSNFKLGSLNSNIALFSMLLVASSGLFGRYLYQQIHKGLYGEQISFANLDSDYQLSKTHLQKQSFFTDVIQQLLHQIEETLTQRSVSIFTSLWARRQIKIIRKKSSYSLKQKHNDANLIDDDAFNNIDIWNSGLSKLDKMAGHALYARLFSLWHMFHLPLFFMMIIAAIVHIFVVHIY